MRLCNIPSYVLVISVMLSAVSCRKNEMVPIKLPQTTDFTKNMQAHGVYELEGLSSYSCWLCSPTKYTTDTGYQEITVEVLNDSNIYVHFTTWNRLFTYDHATAESNVYECRECDGYHQIGTITYYPYRDSLVYYSYGRTSGDSYEATMHSL